MSDCLLSRAKLIRLPIKQGETKVIPFVVEGSDGIAADITGYTFAAQVRRKPSSADAVASFTYSITDATNGLVTLSLTAAQTAAIPAGDRETDPASQYVWDFFAVSPTNVRTQLAHGPVVVEARVTVIA